MENEAIVLWFYNTLIVVKYQSNCCIFEHRTDWCTVQNETYVKKDARISIFCKIFLLRTLLMTVLWVGSVYQILLLRCTVP